jgi:NADH:ubiquinone oxidoreductase subunit F (NADH-binding)
LSGAGYAIVPAGYNGDVAVLRGSRLLSGVSDARNLAAHRQRWPESKPLSADDLVALTERVDLRGRGGAAFPFSRKLSTAQSSGRRRAVVLNASEGEPGSAKDSALLLTVPHVALDGAVLVARALGVDTVHVVVPGERPAMRPAIDAAIAERVDDGIGFSVHETSGGFVGGQARAALELIAGRENLPVTAWTPEAVSGLRARPTLLSNAETFAQVAVLASIGPAQYARTGTAEEAGTTLLTVAGDGPGAVVVEVPLGIRLADVLDHCGHDPSSTVLMGGYHGAWLPPDEVAARRLSRGDLAAAGATLGAGVVLPVEPSACPVDLTAAIVAYLAGQSARRCGPCRNGLPALAEACAVLAAGSAGRATVTRIEELCGLVKGRGACAHPDGTVRLVRSLLTGFGDEVAAHSRGGCRLRVGSVAR